MLAADAGFDGVVVRLAGELAKVERVENATVRAGGGASLAVVVKRAEGGRWRASSSAARSRARSVARCG